jgi:hypothetical protein
LSGDAVQYVRTTLNYSGVVMTDDLSAPYIEGGNLPSAIAKAVEAGVDMPLFTGGDTTIQQAIAAIKQLPDADSKVTAALQRINSYTTGTKPITSSSSCCPNGGTASLTGDNNLAKIFNYLTDPAKGLTPAQAAGVIGNMITESGLNPERLQGTALNDLTTAQQAGNSSLGWGIVQWTPAGKMINPTLQAHKDPNDLGVQLDFLWNQLNTNEKAALDALKQTSTPEAAAQSFEVKYERPSAINLVLSLPIRQLQAIAVLNYSTGTPLPPNIAQRIYGMTGTASGAAQGVTATSLNPSQSCSSSAGSLGVYKNPFRDLKDSH